MTWLWVALGAAVGAPLRFLVSGWLDTARSDGDSRSGGPGPLLPWGTLAVNVAGSSVLGWASASVSGSAGAALVGVGFCGALTTYSAFAVQTVGLGWRRGAWYATVTVCSALAACTLGYAAGGG